MEKQYIDISNIEKNPKLFLKIYKAFQEEFYQKNIEKFSRVTYETPQALAEIVLSHCKAGREYAQFLVKPENPILTVCRNEDMTRRQLADMLGIRVTRIENCLSRQVCSKSVKRMLQERFDYIKD